MTEEEYAELLKQHDYYYQYSDDHRVYTRGREQAQRLSSLANSSPKFKQMYQEYIDSKSMSG